jgi:hypothetical protein
VLKTTNGGGGDGIVICKDIATFNREEAIRKLKKALDIDIYKILREWPYKDVCPRILAEELISDGSCELLDYKVHVFGGIPKIIQVDYNRFVKHQRTLYDVNWKKINVFWGFSSDDERLFEKPMMLPKLLDLAAKLSVGIPYVRVDFYIKGQNIYFGELTFFHGSGFEEIKPHDFDLQLGEWIVLPS